MTLMTIEPMIKAIERMMIMMRFCEMNNFYDGKVCRELIIKGIFITDK